MAGPSNGTQVKVEGQPQIYVAIDGKYHHIPDPDTYQRLFSGANVDQVPSIEDGLIGLPLTSGASLIRGEVSGAIFLLSNEMKRHISSPATMTKFHFNGNRVYNVPEYLLHFIPGGADIS